MAGNINRRNEKSRDMSKKNIDVGTVANDGTGDTLRGAFQIGRAHV